MTGHVLRQLEREGTVARVGRSGLRLLRPDQLDVGAPTPRTPALHPVEADAAADPPDALR